MKRVALPLLLAGVLIAIAVAGWWLKRPADAVAVACADPVAGCRFDHRGREVRVLFSQQPAPMQAFGVRVRAPGVAHVSAEFHMVGMDMGFNRYDLRAAGNDTFAAQVTLPVCVSGRRDWTLHLTLDGDRYILPFSSG